MKHLYRVVQHSMFTYLQLSISASTLATWHYHDSLGSLAHRVLPFRVGGKFKYAHLFGGLYNFAYALLAPRGSNDSIGLELYF